MTKKFNVRFAPDKKAIVFNIEVWFGGMWQAVPSRQHIELPCEEMETLAHDILDLLAKEHPLKIPNKWPGIAVSDSDFDAEQELPMFGKTQEEIAAAWQAHREEHEAEREREIERACREWWCGACGGVHGWVCPYFGGPGRFNPPTCSEAEGRRQMEQDKKEMVGAFWYLRKKTN